MLKKLWNDPVGSKVIAAAIVGLAGIALVSYRHWWSVIWLGITDAHAYLVSTTPVRHWVFGVLVLLSAMFVLLIISLAVSAYQPTRNPYDNLLIRIGPDWASYTSDNFFGLKGSWKYDGPDILFHAYRPHFDYQVFPDDTSGYSSRITFFCDSCRRNVAT